MFEFPVRFNPGKTQGVSNHHTVLSVSQIAEKQITFITRKGKSKGMLVRRHYLVPIQALARDSINSAVGRLLAYGNGMAVFPVYSSASAPDLHRLPFPTARKQKD